MGTAQECLAKADKFTKEFEKCFDPKNFADLKKCDTKSDNDEAKKKKNKCVKRFQDCKKAQDDAVDGVSTCKKVNKCGGVLNKTEAQRLDILRPLKEALANPKFMDALKKLGLHEGPGDDGNVPAGRI